MRPRSAMNLPAHIATRQQGAVLIVSLIILLIMTLIGLSSMQNTTLEEKMAGNYRDKNLSFQAAEMTLREGEGWIADQTKEPDLSTDSCSANCDVWDSDTLLAALSSSSYLDDTLWSDSRARSATITIPDVAASPEYFWSSSWTSVTGSTLASNRTVPFAFIMGW